MNRLTEATVRLAIRAALPLAAGAMTLVAAGALAQEADSPDDRLEQIVVTAQKREQTLVEIPQSITVLNGETLARQQADNFKDYLSLIPGLSLEASTPGVSRITLRGINTGGVASTVAVYVDEVPFGSSSGLANGAILSGDFDTFDVARLEVLRGPQGTLYGASSLGGVMKFVTNAPNLEAFEARAEGGVENVDDGDLGWSAKGLVNVPVSDTFAVRASGFYRFDGGFIDSIGNNPIPSLTDPTVNVVEGSRVAENFNELDTYGGRVSGLFEPGEELSIRLTALFQNIESNGSDSFEADPDTLEPLYGGLVATQYHSEPSEIAYRVFSGTVDWDVGPGSLTSVTSYGTFEQEFRSDFALFLASTVTLLYGDPVTRPLSAIQHQITAIDKFTQEFRYASPENDTFEWLVGAFFTNEESGINPQEFFAVEAGTDVLATDVPTIIAARIDSELEEYAGFGNATWHLTDRFDLTFGGRASRNEQSASQVLDQTGLGGGVIAFDEANSSEDVFTWSLAPRLQLTDESAVYARIATGYRPGGPNVLPPGAPPGTPGSYESDSLTSYEVGLKANWLDNALSFDAAAYWLDWEDIQLLAVVNNVGLNANGGTAVSKGLEFTAAFWPTDNLNVSLNGAWTDAYLTENTDPIVGGLDGDPLPWVPDWSTTFGVDYEWAPMGDVTAWVGGDLSYTGERTADFGQRDATGALREAESYTTLDLRAGFNTGRWSIEAYAQNVTDEQGITSLGGFDPLFVAGGAATVSIIRPRTIGVTVGMEF